LTLVKKFYNEYGEVVREVKGRFVNVT